MDETVVSNQVGANEIEIDPKIILGLFNIAAVKDDSRPVLQCVHVTNAKAEAADGFIYASIKLSNELAKTVCIMIPPTLLPFIKKCRKDATVTVSETDGKVSVASQTNGTMILPGIAEQTEKDKANGFPRFPNISHVMPVGDPVPISWIGLDGALMVKFTKCLQDWQDDNKHTPPLHLAFYGSCRPVLITCKVWGNDRFLGLQMPMHVREEDK